MHAYARVAVNVPSMAGVFVPAPDGSDSVEPVAFDYEVPADLVGRLRPGHLTTVPFGNRIVQAVVLRLIDSPAVAETKSLLGLVDPDPVLTATQLLLAEWMAETTLAPLSALIGLFLPPGMDQQADTLFANNPDAASSAEAAARESQRRSADLRLMELLGRRGPLRGRQIDRALPHVDWRKSAQYLVRNGRLLSHSVLPPVAVRPKLIRTAQLAVAPDVAREAMDNLGRTEAVCLRRQRALELLIERPQAINISWVYAESGCNSADLQELAQRDLIVLREQEIWRDPLNRSPAGPPAAMTRGAAPLALSSEQQTAWRAIECQLASRLAGEAGPTILLQGVTGSGKTELYLQATAAAVLRGRQTIMLVPEIALTPQTVDRFVARFPGQVGLVHSKLSPGERYDTWRRARSGALKVIIGPRSALFTPLQDLGLIIADECHDASYHQAEPPFYDALAAAEAYSRFSGALCILGSATPTVVQRYQSDTGRTIRLQLTERIASASGTQPAPQIDLPTVDVVDLREELKAGNLGVFSRQLRTSLEAVLRRGEQAILFLNRRGTATYVFCRNCGYVVRCPRCDSPLTYHSSRPQGLLCHRCGYERKMPRTCPDCGHLEIRAYGLGTEKVEAEVQSAFPGARTLRWDWETTRQKDAHEIILHHFANGHADVLIGTQMLAKGLDLPRVTLVGIIIAEAGLFLPDPFAAERVFQLLTQVSGRAGRSTRGGRVILQTFVPESHVIRAAAAHDVEGFHGHELEQRRRLGYPPFARLLRLEYRHFDPARAEQAARDEAARLAALLDSDASTRTTLIGPAPSFFSKVDGKYRWQIVLRGARFEHLFQGQRLQDWRLEPDPVSLL